MKEVEYKSVIEAGRNYRAVQKLWSFPTRLSITQKLGI